MSEKVYSQAVTKAFILKCQQFSIKENQKKISIYEIIKNIGCVQIDTINVVERSHYLTIFSRIGNYPTEDLDQLAYSPKNKKLFEYWFHCASLIPFDYYKYTLNKKKAYQDVSNAFWKEWLTKKSNIELLKEVKNYIINNGPVKSSDFEGKKSASGWWNWKPAKMALELLYNRGDLMVSNRIDFHRQYDIAELVLPPKIDKTVLSEQEEKLFLLELSAKALGASFLKEIADYFYLKSNIAKPLLKILVDTKILIPIKVEAVEGVVEMFIHKSNLKLLKGINELELKNFATTILSPFDNLFWAKKRNGSIWNFKQVLEAYKPAEKREWGYFSMPILFEGELIGRLEPKLHRKEKLLVIKYISIEKCNLINEQFYNEIVKTINSFMMFNNATSVLVENIIAPDFDSKYLKKCFLKATIKKNFPISIL